MTLILIESDPGHCLPFAPFHAKDDLCLCFTYAKTRFKYELLRDKTNGFTRVKAYKDAIISQCTPARLMTSSIFV